jgi:hypothetical protein
MKQRGNFAFFLLPVRYWITSENGECHVALVRTDISEECITSIMRMTRIDELWTT